MKTIRYLIFGLLIAALLLAACSSPATEEPTEAPPPDAPEATEAPAPEEPAPMDGVTCDQPVKIGFITDLTGGLAIYGTMAERGFMAGLEYATGGPATGENTYMIDDCEIQVLIRDDQSTAETTATLARELIDVENVDILVGTVSSGATASLQEVAAENQVPLIVAPAAANDITGINFNEYTFRTSRSNYQDAINLCEYLVTQYDTFVQISPDYAFGYGGAAAFRDACSFFGGQFPIEDIFAPLDTQDFTPYIEQMQDFRRRRLDRQLGRSRIYPLDPGCHRTRHDRGNGDGLRHCQQ